MLCKKGTPHCCDAPLFGQGSQINGKQLPLKLLVLRRHRQPGVPTKTTQGSATLGLGLCSPLCTVSQSICILIAI